MARPGRSERGGERRRLNIPAGDAVAGVSMAFILIPQALAYAQVAGMPAHIGLYAAALPPLAAAFFASSPWLQTGPSAVTAILTAGALAPLAVPGTPEYVRLGALLALAVGVIRIGFGALRAGRIVFLMSEPVLRGFTVGAAILILISQLPAVLGVAPADAGIGAALVAVVRMSEWNLHALALAAATIVVVVLARKIHPLVPAIVVVTAAGIWLSARGFYDGPTVGAVPEGLPPIGLSLPWTFTPWLLLPGVVIALAGFSEAASIARTYAALERQRWDPDREFISQGVANLASAVSGGFPVGGSFSRSGLAHLGGAKTRWSGAITGLTVLAFLPFASILAPLPIAVLGALVIVAVAGLIRVQPMACLWRISRPQFAVATTTFALTLLLAPHIEQAVILGILMAGAVHLWRELHLGLDAWAEDDGTLNLRPHGVLWFGSAEVLKSSIGDLVADHPDAHRVRLHMERLGRVDVTAALVLNDSLSALRSAGLDVDVSGIHPETARALRAVVGPDGEPAPLACADVAEPAEPAARR